MRVILLGTPDFAIPSLNMLLHEGYDVAAVVCQPDRPRGRRGKPVACPTKAEALRQGLEVLSFERLRSPEGVAALTQLRPDVMVTAAYGQILSRAILRIPPMGCVNVHGSLLPKYRGPAPIQWAIINGETTTGITTMLTDRGVDTGDILLQREIAIGPEETAGELFDRMAVLGADVLRQTLRLMASGELTPVPQNPALATHYPMLTRDDGRIDWTASARDIVSRVRGVNPWPGAFTSYQGSVLKVWKAAVREGDGAAPGSVIAADTQKGLIIAAGSGSVKIMEMQASGGRRMDPRDYLRGHGIEIGSVMGS